MPRDGSDAAYDTLVSAPQSRRSILGRFLSGGRSHAWLAGIWTFADQGLVSLANFLLMVLLARELPAPDFGAFVLLLMAIYLANNVQTSLVSRPHNIVGANLNDDAFRQYTARVLTLQLAMTGLFAIGGLAIAGGLRFVDESTALLTAATTAALVAWQLQEFARQVQFTRREVPEVFRYDLISYGGQVLLVIGLAAVDQLTAVTAMLCIGGSSLASALYALPRIGIRPAGWPFPILRMNWRMGRWVLGDNLGQWLSSMLFPVLVAALAGTAATAVYRLVMNVVAPLHVVFSALPSFAAPRASRAYHEGGAPGVARFLVPVGVVMAVPIGAYLILVSVFGEQVLNLMYGPGYSQHIDLIWLFAVGYFAQFLISVQAIALLAAGNARAILTGRLVSIALTLTFGVSFTAAFGVTGAVLGLVVVNLGFCGVLAAVLMRGEEIARRGERSSPWRIALRGES